MLTLEKIKDAQATLSNAIYKTDVIRASKLSSDYELYLKTENLQKTGSFKIRGAYYKISRLSAEEKKRGVIACSAGNHAQGVALAASKNGIRSLICLPEGAPISKVEATRGYGAEICLVPGITARSSCKKNRVTYLFIPSTTKTSLPDRARSVWKSSPSLSTSTRSSCRWEEAV